MIVPKQIRSLTHLHTRLRHCTGAENGAATGSESLPGSGRVLITIAVSRGMQCVFGIAPNGALRLRPPSRRGATTNVMISLDFSLAGLHNLAACPDLRAIEIS